VLEISSICDASKKKEKETIQRSEICLHGGQKELSSEVNFMPLQARRK